MAELVRQPRGRRGNKEREETAIAVQGPLVRRQRGPGGQIDADWNYVNQNHLNPGTGVLTDEDVIHILKKSGRVSPKELCLYITPQVLLNQNDRVDPIVDAIRDIINNMAKTRRLILLNKLRNGSNSTEAKALQTQLDYWPVQVQEMQGQIEALKKRYLRIPPLLVEDVSLLE